MAGNCGICGEPCDSGSGSVKCSGNCGTCVHLNCVPIADVKTRGSKKDFLCDQCKKDKKKAPSSIGSSGSTPGTALTKEFLISMMETFKTEVFNVLETYNKEVSDIKKEVSDLKNSLIFISEKFDETNKLLEQTNKHYNEMRTEVEDLRRKNSELSQEVKDMGIRLRHMEQYSRKCNVEIAGVPVTANEDPIAVVEDIGKAIGTTLCRDEVAAAHRVPSFRSGRTPNLIVQFTTRMTRDLWITKAKERKNMTADAINGSFPKTRVFIGEHLTLETKVLLAGAKDKCKEIGWKYVWCREGKIFVRRCDGERCVRVDSRDDLAKLR